MPSGIFGLQQPHHAYLKMLYLVFNVSRSSPHLNFTCVHTFLYVRVKYLVWFGLVLISPFTALLFSIQQLNSTHTATAKPLLYLSVCLSLFGFHSISRYVFVSRSFYMYMFDFVLDFVSARFFFLIPAVSFGLHTNIMKTSNCQ